MAKNSAFVKARTQDLRRRSAQRSQRSKVERGKRLAQDDRRIRRVARQWALPTKEDTALLLGQFTQACRLPNASASLCALIRYCAGANGRDPGDPEPLRRMAELLLKAQDTPAADLSEDEETDAGAPSTETVLQDILRTECGSRVVTMLLPALQSVEVGKSVAKAILEQFEANEALVTHHVACRVLTALVQSGPMDVKCGVLEMLRERSGAGSAVDLLMGRHTATTIVQLLEHLPIETSAWLAEELGLGEEGRIDAKASTDAVSRKGKEDEESAKAGGDEGKDGGLRELIEHPVSWRILAQLIVHTPFEKRLRFLKLVSFSELSQTRRGTRFLAALLSADASEEGKITSAASAAILKALGKIVKESAPLLQDMSRSPHGNFVVQKLIQSIPFVRGDDDKNALELLSRVVRVITHNGDVAAMHDLASHAIGVHVICTLIDTAFSLNNSTSSKNNYHRVVEEIASFWKSSKHFADAMCDQYGSLLIRHLMPLVKLKQSNLGKLLASTVAQTMNSLLYDPIGNLVVQEYFRNIGADAASKFTSKLMDEEILAMCRSPYASHVLFTLLDVINPATRVSLCSTLKPHALAIATHVNGRFIVERLVTSSREVRDELVRQFYALAREKGTQHVLCSLVSHLDPRGKTHVIEKIIVPRLFELATHPCGSIVLQKLMQSDAAIAAAVNKRIAQEGTLRNDLAQNFYGKFVVQIAEN